MSIGSWKGKGNLHEIPHLCYCVMQPGYSLCAFWSLIIIFAWVFDFACRYWHTNRATAVIYCGRCRLCRCRGIQRSWTLDVLTFHGISKEGRMALAWLMRKSRQT